MVKGVILLEYVKRFALKQDVATLNISSGGNSCGVCLAMTGRISSNIALVPGTLCAWVKKCGFTKH